MLSTRALCLLRATHLGKPRASKLGAADLASARGFAKMIYFFALRSGITSAPIRSLSR
jgi:hypothetical protein